MGLQRVRHNLVTEQHNKKSKSPHFPQLQPCINTFLFDCNHPQFDSSVGKESAWNAGDPRSIPGLGRCAGEGIPTLVLLGFPGGSAGEDSACNVGALDSTPGMGRSPGEEKGYLLQYSGLENSMDCIVHGVTKSQT